MEESNYEKSLNGKTDKEKMFDHYLNKVIIMNSKLYFKTSVKREEKEETIINDDNYYNFLCDLLVKNFKDESKEMRLDLEDAIGTLSAIEQSVIFLLFKKDLTLDEASKMLSICSKSVSRIKQRALKRLKDYFGGEY